MNLKGVINRGRDLDKYWQRKRHPTRRQILVNARTAMNYATIAPIVERLRSDSRLRFYLTASEDPDSAKQIYAEAPSSCRLISPFASAFMRFDAYIAADFLWVKLPRGTRRIQTFHGVAGKYRTIYDSPSRSVRAWDRLFFINKHRLQHFIDNGAIDADSPAARLIGMPKLDCLVDGSLRRNDVLASLGIDPLRKTVMYAPTWSPYSSLPAMGEELVRRLGEAGYAVIGKLHDRSRDSQYVNSGGIDWGARLEPLLQSTGGVLAKGSNSSKYLPAADALITDHSSVGFEYLLLDRPLIRIEMPELLKNTDVEPRYVKMLASASTSVRDVSQVVAALERGFADPKRDSKSRREIANEMFYEPGGATERAANELYELIELEPSPT